MKRGLVLPEYQTSLCPGISLVYDAVTNLDGLVYDAVTNLDGQAEFHFTGAD